MCARDSSSCSYRWTRSKQIWSRRREPRSLCRFSATRCSTEHASRGGNLRSGEHNRRNWPLSACVGPKPARCLPSAWPALAVSFLKSTAPSQASRRAPGRRASGPTGESPPRFGRARSGLRREGIQYVARAASPRDRCHHARGLTPATRRVRRRQLLRSRSVRSTAGYSQ